MDVIAIFTLGLKKPFAFFETCSIFYLMMNSAIKLTISPKRVQFSLNRVHSKESN
jgi:hypothetical protein